MGINAYLCKHLSSNNKSDIFLRKRGISKNDHQTAVKCLYSILILCTSIRQNYFFCGKKNVLNINRELKQNVIKFKNIILTHEQKKKK